MVVSAVRDEIVYYLCDSNSEFNSTFLSLVEIVMITPECAVAALRLVSKFCLNQMWRRD